MGPIMQFISFFGFLFQTEWKSCMDVNDLCAWRTEDAAGTAPATSHEQQRRSDRISAGATNVLALYMPVKNLLYLPDKATKGCLPFTFFLAVQRGILSLCCSGSRRRGLAVAACYLLCAPFHFLSEGVLFSLRIRPNRTGTKQRNACHSAWVLLCTHTRCTK